MTILAYWLNLNQTSFDCLDCEYEMIYIINITRIFVKYIFLFLRTLLGRRTRWGWDHCSNEVEAGCVMGPTTRCHHRLVRFVRLWAYIYSNCQPYRTTQPTSRTRARYFHYYYLFTNFTN